MRNPASAATTPPPDADRPVPAADAPPPGTRLQSHYSRCFGCGPAHPTGLHLVGVVGDGVSVTTELAVGEEHQGAPGLAHGGVVAAAFDEALGMLLHVLRRPAVTGRLETDFIAPVPVGRVLHVAARCTGVAGRKVYAVAHGRLDAPTGPLAAQAAGLFVTVPRAHFATHGRADAWPAEESMQRYNP